LSIYAPWFALYKSSVGAQILIATDFLSNLQRGVIATYGAPLGLGNLPADSQGVALGRHIPPRWGSVLTKYLPQAVSFPSLTVVRECNQQH
jgi:hypothetical protein